MAYRFRITRWLILMLMVGGLWLGLPLSQVQAANPAPWWEFQSIDTMKYSRDPSREVLTKPEFDATIQQQVKDIAETGATHVGIATPYDDEFLPVLRRWVSAARQHGLKVWFRGNFSGWEGWFEYPKITRAEHLKKTQEFIYGHPELFEDGDLFSACPECENGGPGDPRMNGDATGHRQFLIDEYKVTREAFHRIGKNVPTNLHSMNGDVARLIMDEKTTQELGGVVTIDHYVKSPEKLAQDVKDFAKRSKAKVILGEYGAPIPDIHGNLSPADQAAWLNSSMALLAEIPELVGVNYWVSVGGSTRLWNDDKTPRPAVKVMEKYFKPQVASGSVRTPWGQSLKDVTIDSGFRTVTTDEKGRFMIPVTSNEIQLKFTHPQYHEAVQTLDLIPDAQVEVQLQPITMSLGAHIRQWWWNLSRIFTSGR